MVNPQKVNSLLQREVSREEFLRYLGIAFLGLVGITHVLQSLHKSLGTDTIPGNPKRTVKSSGYGGGSSYGQ